MRKVGSPSGTWLQGSVVLILPFCNAGRSTCVTSPNHTEALGNISDSLVCSGRSMSWTRQPRTWLFSLSVLCGGGGFRELLLSRWKYRLYAQWVQRKTLAFSQMCWSVGHVWVYVAWPLSRGCHPWACVWKRVVAALPTSSGRGQPLVSMQCSWVYVCSLLSNWASAQKDRWVLRRIHDFLNIALSNPQLLWTFLSG